MVLRGLCGVLFLVIFCRAEYLGHLDNSAYEHARTPTADLPIDSGSTLSLSCSADDGEFISWQYPRLSRTEDGDLPDGVSINTRAERSDNGTIYYGTLTIDSVTATDTGLYRCYCSAVEQRVSGHVHHQFVTFHEYMANVYVSDAENLFQGETQEKLEFMSEKTRRDITLPCAVNNPETEVQLYKISGTERHEVPPRRYRYDDMVGYTLLALRLNDSGEYICEARDDDNDRVQEKRFFIHVMRSITLIQKPVLRGLTPVNSGSTSVLKCQVAVGKGQVTEVTWWKVEQEGEDTQITANTPNMIIDDPIVLSSICSGNRTMCSFRRRSMYEVTLPVYSMYEKLSARLRIVDADPSTHSGAYYCKVWSDEVTRTSNEFTLDVAPGAADAVVEVNIEESPTIITYNNRLSTSDSGSGTGLRTLLNGIFGQQ